MSPPECLDRVWYQYACDKILVETRADGKTVPIPYHRRMHHPYMQYHTKPQPPAISIEATNVYMTNS